MNPLTMSRWLFFLCTQVSALLAMQRRDSTWLRLSGTAERFVTQPPRPCAAARGRIGFMTVLELLVLLLIAGICGAIGQAIAGYSHLGCLASVALGFIGAVLGTWIARSLWSPGNIRVSSRQARFPGHLVDSWRGIIRGFSGPVSPRPALGPSLRSRPKWRTLKAESGRQQRNRWPRSAFVISRARLAAVGRSSHA